MIVFGQRLSNMATKSFVMSSSIILLIFGVLLRLKLSEFANISTSYQVLDANELLLHKGYWIKLGLEAFLAVSNVSRPAAILSSSTYRYGSPNLLRHCLLLLCGDVHLNPGPRNNLNGNPVKKFACGIWNMIVSWSDEGVCCDDCNTWFHTAYQQKGRHYPSLPSMQAKLLGSVAIVTVRTIGQYFHTIATWKYLMFTNCSARVIQISHSPHSKVLVHFSPHCHLFERLAEQRPLVLSDS